MERGVGDGEEVDNASKLFYGVLSLIGTINRHQTLPSFWTRLSSPRSMVDVRELKQARFRDADGNRKSSHNHIPVVKYLSSLEMSSIKI